ncbi:filamentous hemagglutinin N-terminal domain-containing protein [Nitrogeniibacter mangrovi]|uniref:Filamentous hemagglutinin N-terminal domain-containing protein n=1 Tax=Nitrogeniibacter mangrovi TaxID=2016596 RepID=A0A6C1B1I2_9RHOO|nr:filamentous haemagglutinin family protein [Nitrogeniibacter mangrovi]QID16210.1 filamentous hemagglutinin N-terminal domain-containing protein [Nitrogeniibacter mangrovi]
MNRNRYRLVMSRRLGVRIPVAEHVSSCPKGAAPLAVAVALAALAGNALAGANLPTPAAAFVRPGSPGTANLPNIVGQTMTIRQTSQAPVVMQWQNFDIGRGYTVRFDQPSAQSRAINVVLPGGPRSDIYGNLQANGQVYLFNQAGILFGPGARVDVSGLVASTLKLNDKLIDQSLSSLSAYDASSSQYVWSEAALSRDGTAGDIRIERGAHIVAAKNGRVLIAAPNVSNAGEISTPEGQTILAAGEKLYLADSVDSRLRGVLVEVSGGGNAHNEATGELLAERGNITLAGLNVAQRGAARATTSVTLNGSIYLKARDNVVGNAGERTSYFTGGAVVLGEQSTTEVVPETANTDDVLRDDAPFNPSEVEISGKTIDLERDARISATAGKVTLTTLGGRPVGDSNDFSPDPDSAIRIADGARIDVSGLRNVAVAADRDVVEIELRGDELKDSPLQRDTAAGRPLYGEKIYMDVVKGSQVADGDTPLADVSGYRAGIERDVAELSTAGGDIVLQSEGTVSVDAGATLDVSGGSVVYRAQMDGTKRLVPKTLLQTVAGTWVAAESASAKLRYTGRTRTLLQQVPDRLVGNDAGRVVVTGRQVRLDGALKAETVNGYEQRTGAAQSARWYDWSYTPGDAGAVQAFVTQMDNLLLERERNRVLVEQYLGNAQRKPYMTQTGRRTWTGATRAQGGVLELRSNLADAATSPSVGNIVLTDAPPAAAARDADTLYLRASWLGGGGFNQFLLNTAGQFTVPAGVRLVGEAGARLTVNARQVDVEGAQAGHAGARIRLPGGEIALTTTDTSGAAISAPEGHGIAVGAGATLSTAGLWTNDLSAPPTALDPAASAVDGGRVTLASNANLTVEGAIDVSAGAWQGVNGAIAYGDGGAIALSTGRFGDGVRPERVLSLGEDAILSGYATASTDGFDSGHGGRLTIDASSLFITRLHDARDPLAPTPARTLVLSEDVLRRGGFADVALTGKTDVTVEDGAHLPLVAQVRRLGTAQRAAASGGSPQSFTLGADTAGVGGATSLSLTSAEEGVGAIRVGTGAHIATVAGGRIALDAAASIAVDGALVAHGGRIDLSTALASPTLTDRQFLDPTNKIHIGQHGRLDVSGMARATPGTQWHEGAVLDGGAIQVDAGRGYVVVQSGAELNADGATGVFDVVSPFGVVARDRTLASAGGEIALSAREGLLVDGLLSARAGAGGVAGGALSLALTAQGQWVGVAGEAFGGDPNPQRRLVLTTGGSAGADAIAANAIVPSAQHLGTARVAVDTIAAGGFQDVRLASSDRITVDGDTALTVPGRLRIETPNLVGDGASALALRAASVELTQHDDTAQRKTPLAPTAATGTGSLSVEAGQIDVRGQVAVSGFAQVGLASADELRFSGQDNGAGALGRLVTNGDLSLSAAVIYPTSGAEVSVEVRNNPTGRITLAAVGADHIVYSALGSLSLIAPQIEHGGRLRAPFGALTLAAGTLTDTGTALGGSAYTMAANGRVTLRDGSVTSISADGATIPYGQTQVAGRDWVFDTGASLDALTAAPDARVALTGDTVAVDDGALVDLSGGGDLQAWEFIAGRGGSTDILANEASDTYALLPLLGAGSAPYAADAWAGSALKSGQVVRILDGAAGLAPGVYALLPGRYGLMAGAYTIRVRSDMADLPHGADFVGTDGIPVVAARFGERVIGGAVFDNRTVGVEVLTGRDVRLRSEYLETYASRAFDQGGSVNDAGRLAVRAGAAMDLSGIVRANRSAGARGAQIDLTADRLAVLADPLTAQAGEVVLSTGMLAGLDAESLLLGATRERLADDAGTTVWALSSDAASGGASQVRVDTAGGDPLQAPEIILAARDRVAIAADSRIEATAGADETAQQFRLGGDGALLRLSSGGAGEVRRSGTVGASGDLALGRNAVLAGRSLTLDATGSVALAGADAGHRQFDLSGAEGAVALAASRLAFGQVPAGTGGLVLDDAALAEFEGAGALSLRSYSTVDLYGNASIGSATLDALMIDAAGIVSHDGAGLTQTITAGTVTLSNRDGATGATAAAQPGSTLRIAADRLVLGETGATDFTISGAERSEWAAASEVVGSGTGQVHVGGDLAIETGRVAVATGADYAVNADGALDVAATPLAAPVAPAGLGGRLAMSATQIAVGGRIEATAGRVVLSARDGDVVIDSGDTAKPAVVSAAGTDVALGPEQVALPAGEVALESRQGDVRVGPAGVLDVSAPGGADAGAVTIAATNGTFALDGQLKATIDTADGAAPQGGQLDVDVAHLDTPNGNLAAIAQRSAEFTRLVQLRVRAGDLRLDAGDRIAAQDIGLFADDGHITLQGELDASGDKGGTIRAYANAGARSGSGVLSVDGARLLARGEGDGGEGQGTAGEGGRIELGVSARDGSTETPRLSLVAGTLDVSSQHAEGGRVVLSAPRGADGVSVAMDPIDTHVVDLVGARDVVVQGYVRESASNIVTQGNNSATTLNLGGVFDLAADAVSGAHLFGPSATGGREAVLAFGRDLLGAVAGDDFEQLARADGGAWLGMLLGDKVRDAAGDDALYAQASAAIDAAFRATRGGTGNPERSVAAVLAAGLGVLDVPAPVVAAVEADLTASLAGGASSAAALGSARKLLAAHGYDSTSAAGAFLNGTAADLIDTPRDAARAALAAGAATTPQAALEAAVASFATDRGVSASQAASLASQTWALGNAASGRYRVFAGTHRFLGHADAMIASLGLAGLDPVSANAEVQIVSDGNLTVSQAVDFGNVAITPNAFLDIGTGVLPVWQSGAHAGTLTLKAAGTLAINASVRDGKTRRFSTLSGFLGGMQADGKSEYAADGTGSWAINLVAGADAAAADPLGVIAGGSGDIVIANNAVVRTGTADIQLAAAKDITLAGAGASIQTIGTVADLAFRNAVRLARTASLMGHGGGDIRVDAGGSLTGAGGAVASVSDWLARRGSVDADGTIERVGGTASNPAWYLQPASFGQGIATLGGGDLAVTVGGSVRNVVLATPTAGGIRGEIGDPALAQNRFVTGGGDLSVTAGGEVAGSTLYVGAGSGRVDAASVAATAGAAPVRVALGDATLRVSALGDVNLLDIFNPTLEGTQVGDGPYFSTYGAGSGLAALSAVGSVSLGSFSFGPARLALTAPDGGVTVGGGVLLPDPSTALSLMAGQDVAFEAAMVMSGLDPEAIPLPSRPVENNPSFEIGALAPVPAAAVSDTVATVVSAHGDVIGPDHRAAGSAIALESTLPVSVYAGGDIRDFSFVATHANDDQVSRLTAGGDLYFQPKVTPGTGELLNTSDVGLFVDGPGRITVSAGGSVDLANSLGIVSRGNIDNAYLPERAASIEVLAGTNGADYGALLALARPGDAVGGDVFDQTMIDVLSAQAGRAVSLASVLGDPANATLASRRDGSRAELQRWYGRYDAALVDFMRQRSGNPALDAAAAQAAFAALPANEQQGFYASQRPVLDEILFATLRYSGRIGDALGAGTRGYAPGYAALDATFADGGEGNIEGFLSQFKTLQDVETAYSLQSANRAPADQEHATAIALLAPHGAVNIGVPGGVVGDPTRTGMVAIGKGDVNVVARDDIEVGPSRIFTLGGGAIQGWSSLADIDGGSAAKTAAATPPPTLRPKGDSFELDVSGSVAGGGIATLKKTPDVRNAPVRLYAPNGAVDAGDAGIRVSGDLEIGAQQIIGADNISVGGSLSSSAAPPPPAAPVAAPVASTASDAVDSANELLENSPTAAGPSGASSLLTVEVLAMGDARCDEAARQRGECPAEGKDTDR